MESAEYSMIKATIWSAMSLMSKHLTRKRRRFNKLAVRVTRPGARVRYRSGFFGVSEEKINRSAETGNQKLMTALSSPFAANDVSLRLNALFGNDKKHGAFVRSLLHISAKDLTFTDTPDGSKKAVFDVIAVAFGDNGTAVDQIAKSYTMTVRKDAFEQTLKEGFVYDFTFPMKNAGAYQLRVALRDHGTEKVGSANQFVEVPNLKKNRLTLSGVVLENLPISVYEKRMANPSVIAAKSGDSDPLDGHIAAAVQARNDPELLVHYLQRQSRKRQAAQFNLAGENFPRR